MAPVTPDTHDMNERVRVAVQLAITRPVEDLRARIDILAALLDPAYATVERAIARFESGSRFPTTEREQIADYVIRAIERKVLAADSFPLTHLQTISPSAWVQSFARSCVPSGVTEVRRSRARASSSGSLEERITMPPALIVQSAEDAYLGAADEDLAETLSEQLHEWEAEGHTKYERVIRVGAILRSLRDVPAVHLRTRADRRWVENVIDAPDGAELIRESLIAFRDLCNGNPRWEQMDVDDRLMDLWLDFTADHATTLIDGEPAVAVGIVRSGVTFPPRPQEAVRLELRRALKSLSRRTGWSSLVMDLERSWTAEMHAARRAHDNMDRRTDTEAESERRTDAELWEPIARKAIEFPDAPLGASVRTVDDVDRVLGSALAALSI